MSSATDGTQKVTRLHRRSGESAQAQQASRIFQRLRDLFSQRVRAAVPGLLDEMDDRLYELVERSESNQLQTHYFEVMRQLRLVRGDIERRFASELDAGVKERVAAIETGKSLASEAQQGHQSLSLIGEDEMEEDVAVKNIAVKIRNLAQELLFALDRRVGAVLGTSQMEGECNPFAPECIAGAASRALREIDTTIEVRIVLLKLTDRRLLDSARAAYGEMNELLASLGILPTVHEQISRRPAAAPGHGVAGGQARAQGTPGEWVRAAAHSIGEAAGGPESTAAMGESCAAPVAAMDGELVGVLRSVMSLAGAQGMNSELGAPREELLLGEISTLQREAVSSSGGVNVLRQLRSAPVAAQFSHVDNLMIDVVAMMFDYVLDDENIVESVRTLIARLQIPTLKVAMIDKTFFARRAHPARQFVNDLAAVGATMNASVSRGDPTYDRIETIVHRILTDFAADLQIFDLALEELRGVAEEEDRDAAENAWQSTHVVKERDRLEQCRREASEQVQGRLDEGDVPSFIADFLLEHWRHLLCSRLYQDGEESSEWRAALQIMDNLIWSVSRKQGPQERDRLLAMLPFLLHRLKAAMEELCVDAQSRTDFLNQLSRVHLGAIRMEDERPAPDRMQDAPRAEREPALTPVPEPPSAQAKQEAQEAQAQELEVARLRGALERANALVFDTASTRIQCKGMGTTAVALKLIGNQAVCAHVGDSRIYRMRDGELEQLSRDHTYRQQMLDSGKVTEEEAHTIASNLIVRAIGIDQEVKVDVSLQGLCRDDLFLLCSDGLSDMLDDARLSDLVSQALADGTTLENLARTLVDAANDAGGRDNISVAMMRIVQLPEDEEVTLPEVASAFASDSGRVRAHNEDCVDADAANALLVLADGMGGHNAGEVASAMTVRVVLDEYESDAQAESEVVGDGAFDFQAINAAFWDDTVGQAADGAPAELDDPDVESITLSSANELDGLFDLDGGSRAPGLRKAAASDPYLARILGLAVGEWVEFRPEDGPSQRASVSWVAEDQSRFLFTGRRGQKVAEATPYGLALELRSHRLRVLDSAPLLDRAIRHLSTRVRAAVPGGAAAATMH